VRDRAFNDPHEDIRKAAVSALTEYFRTDSQTLPLLRDRAVSDDSPKPNNDKKPDDEQYVRETAIEALAKYWPTHPDTLPLLGERAENDPTPWLREKARELLEQLQKKKS
jgi:hypothetical protein